MKSKRAKEYIKTIELNKANVDYCLDHGRVSGFLLIDIENAVELAEQDAEEEIEDKCKGFVEILETLQEEHEQQIEALKKRAVEACCFACTQSGAGCDHRLRTDDYYLCDILNNFIQKLNER